LGLSWFLVFAVWFGRYKFGAWQGVFVCRQANLCNIAGIRTTAVGEKPAAAGIHPAAALLSLARTINL
jgi:hypothetical protein